MTAGHTITASPEFDLLLSSARTRLEGSAAERIEDLIAGPIEWEHFLFLAQFHRVTEVVYQTLRKQAPYAIAGDVENFLRGVAHRTVAYNMMLVQELARLKDVLESEGIRFFTFKGPALAQEAYGNLGLRSSADLDILIRPEDLERLEELLFLDGYEFGSGVRDLSPFRRRAYVGLSKQLSLINVKRMVGLDVHTGAMPPGYRYSFGFDELWERSRLERVGPESVRLFAPEDTLHLLCYHGVKNRWDQLKYVTDVAEYVRSHPDLEWETLIRRAEETHGERILYHGLHVASRLSDAPVPKEIAGRYEQEGYIEELAEIVLENLKNSYREPLDWRTRATFHLRTQDDLRNRARYSLYSLMRHVGGVIDI
ncbi:MAG: nucleotidyltransferase family protein [Rhodothermales bacterium]